MKRREAIKSLTLSTGLVISGSTWMSLLQSCANEPAIDWVPISLSRDEAKTLRSLCDRLIPKGDTVGALDMKVPLMIDKALNAVLSDEESARYKKGMSLFNGKLSREFHKLSEEKQNEALKTWFDVEPQRALQIRGLVAGPETAESDDNYYIYYFLITTRELTVKGFRESEYVGKELLAYDPVPGVLQGCIDYSEVGKAWSLGGSWF